MSRITIIIISAVAFLVLVFSGVLVYAHYNNQYPEFEDASTDASAIFPVNDGRLSIAPGLDMNLDTGSLISTITPEDLRKLIDLGLPVDSVRFPSIATTIYGDVYVADQRYNVSLPVWQMELVSDSLGNRYQSTGRMTNSIKNVVFLPAEPGDPSRIGADILERFVMEYQYDNNAVVLYSTVPQNYQFVTDIAAPFSWVTFIGTGNRYYIPLDVQGERHEYFIDTALSGIHLKLPPSDTVLVRTPLVDGVISSGRGTVPARMTDDVWVKIGDRSGSHSAIYGDDNNEDYAINPLNYFNQDIVIDFPGRRLYLHHHDR